MGFWNSIKSLKPVSYFSRGRRWVILLFCFLLSFILWLFQALNDNYTKRVTMAVEAPTLPLRYALDETKGIPKEIEIAITASGNELMSYTFRQWFATKPILKLAIDTLQILPEGGYISIGREELIRQIKNTNDVFNEHFNNSNDAHIALFPDYISFSYAPLIEEKVGVFFGGQVDLGEESNRVLVSLTMEPEEVSAFGLNTSIDSLRMTQGLISTEQSPLAVTKEGISSYRVALIAPNGVRLTPDSVTVTTEVAPLKYNSFIASNIMVRNLEEGYNIRLFPSSIKVSYLALDDVKLSDISAQIHPYVGVDEITEGTKKLKVRLPMVPKELHMIQLEPDAVEYIIEKE